MNLEKIRTFHSQCTELQKVIDQTTDWKNRSNHSYPSVSKGYNALLRKVKQFFKDEPEFSIHIEELKEHEEGDFLERGNFGAINKLLPDLGTLTAALSSFLSSEKERISKEVSPIGQLPIIFISYDTDELPLAHYIDSLIKPRIDGRAVVFIARRDIKTGSNPYKVMLEQNLLRASAIIPICSARSKGSQWVWWETATVWACKGEGYVFPLYAHMHPKEFGEPISILFQGRDYFNPDDLAEMLSDILGKLKLAPEKVTLTEEEKARLEKLKNTNLTKKKSEINLSYKLIEGGSNKHIYSLVFSLGNKGNEAYADVSVRLLFPTISLERKDISYQHLKTKQLEGGYTELFFTFSALPAQALAQFRPDLLPGRTLVIYGPNGITNLRYVVDYPIYDRRDSFDVQWELYIDGKTEGNGKVPFATLMNF